MPVCFPIFIAEFIFTAFVVSDISDMDYSPTDENISMKYNWIICLFIAHYNQKNIFIVLCFLCLSFGEYYESFTFAFVFVRFLT